MSIREHKLEARCDADLRRAFEQLAAAKGMRPSELLRLIVAHVLKSSGIDVDHAASPQVRERRTERVSVRFSPSEWQALLPLAEPFGGVRAWLVALTRSRIFANSPQFSLREVQALHESTRELWAIGRNVNQIAHAMNTDLRQAGQLQGSTSRLSELQALKAAIDDHTAKVTALCNASLDRWSDE